MQRSDSRVVWAWLSCALLGAITACDREPDAPRTRGPVGVLTGRVRLIEGADLPAYTAADLVQRVLQRPPRADVPAECAAANDSARTPVTLTEDGLLTNVVVAGSDFTHVAEREGIAHQVAVERCQLRPRTLVAMAGDRIVIENRDAFGFQPLAGPGTSSEPLPRGQRLVLPLSQGVSSIACVPDAPCGRTDMVVLYHPVAAVTDARGQFRIANFPARELVRVTAWHPLFELSETFVWVEPGKSGVVELALKPKARFTQASR